MNFIMAILAFLAGVLGTILGGTQTFVCTGLIGIIVSILSLLHIHIPLLSDVILNIIFLPCIIFNGAGAATAYAALHHPIKGTQTDTSLLFTKDYKVFLCGGLFGLLGYLLFSLFSAFQLPMDIGALVVVIVGVIGRLLFNKSGQYMNKKGFTPTRQATINLFTFQIIFAIIISLLTIGIVNITQMTAIGFYISAFSLIIALKYPRFPATHHISMVVGYAFMQTGNILLSVIFGIIAHLIMTIFGITFNVDCGTHIDPPAVAIGSLSLIIFTLF